jgi:hypothetical protein
MSWINTIITMKNRGVYNDWSFPKEMTWESEKERGKIHCEPGGLLQWQDKTKRRTRVIWSLMILRYEWIINELRGKVGWLIFFLLSPRYVIFGLRQKEILLKSSPDNERTFIRLLGWRRTGRVRYKVHQESGSEEGEKEKPNWTANTIRTRSLRLCTHKYIQK